jgi:hypothetical protein
LIKKRHIGLLKPLQKRTSTLQEKPPAHLRTLFKQEISLLFPFWGQFWACLDPDLLTFFLKSGSETVAFAFIAPQIIHHVKSTTDVQNRKINLKNRIKFDETN